MSSFVETYPFGPVHAKVVTPKLSVGVRSISPVNPAAHRGLISAVVNVISNGSKISMTEDERHPSSVSSTVYCPGNSPVGFNVLLAIKVGPLV